MEGGAGEEDGGELRTRPVPSQDAPSAPEPSWIKR